MRYTIFMENADSDVAGQRNSRAANTLAYFLSEMYNYIQMKKYDRNHKDRSNYLVVISLTV